MLSSSMIYIWLLVCVLQVILFCNHLRIKATHLEINYLTFQMVVWKNCWKN